MTQRQTPPSVSNFPTVDGTAALAQLSNFERLRWGREIVRLEAAALAGLSDRLDESFCRAVEAVLDCRGNVDLGRLDGSDVVLMLSQSGETAEVVDLLTPIAQLGAEIIAITKTSTSTLGQASSVVLELGSLDEAGPNQLAPSTSTTAMMALGDALALVVSGLRGFGPEHFARYHPGGSLGLKLSQVEDAMRPIAQCRVASDSHRVRDVFVEASRPGRRSGAIMLQNEQGLLSGIFTDSDLARLLEQRQDRALDAPIRSVMTAAPTTVALGTPLPEAVDVLAARKISELPVVDEQGRPAGMLDITDVVALLPHDATSVEADVNDSPNTIPFASP